MFCFSLITIRISLQILFPFFPCYSLTYLSFSSFTSYSRHKMTKPLSFCFIPFRINFVFLCLRLLLRLHKFLYWLQNFPFLHLRLIFLLILNNLQASILQKYFWDMQCHVVTWILLSYHSKITLWTRTIFLEFVTFSKLKCFITICDVLYVNLYYYQTRVPTYLLNNQFIYFSASTKMYCYQHPDAILLSQAIKN